MTERVEEVGFIVAIDRIADFEALGQLDLALLYDRRGAPDHRGAERQQAPGRRMRRPYRVRRPRTLRRAGKVRISSR